MASALQLDGIDSAVFEGNGEVPSTLFPESSPFFADIALQEHDPDEAQRLFDELAAEGKPVEFTFLATSLVEIRTVAETVQAQLGAFDNVDVKVEVLDYAAFMPRYAAREFDATIWSANVQEPHTTLWHQFHSASSGNVAGIADAELDAALNMDEHETVGVIGDDEPDIEVGGVSMVAEKSSVMEYLKNPPECAASSKPRKHEEEVL